MNRICAVFFVCSFFLAEAGMSSAELRRASVPDVNMTPTLKSVMAMKSRNNNSTNTKSEETTTAAQFSSNGYILDNGNVAVDNLTNPKCVFYGNYNEGSGDVNQYIDIDTIVFECK